MMHLGKPRQIRTIAVIMALVLTAVSVGIGGSVLAASESPSVFEAGFSGLTNGTVSTTDAVTVAALEKSFYFYNAQRATQNSHTSYFERNEVNGYLVPGEDALSKPKYPDTGVYPAWDLDGYGSAADKPIPTWSLQDGWLSCATYAGEDAFLFRQGNLLYVKDSTTVSGFAALENFKLETSFKFSSTAENDALALIFHAKDAGLAAHPYQNMLAFNADGKLVFGKALGESLNFQSPIAYNDQLKAKDGSALKLEKDHAYRLMLTVIGKTLNFTILDGKTEICTYQTDSVYATGCEKGYLAIGISNNGPAIADVRVERLNDTGATVDFSVQVPGYSFGFTATTLCDYRTYYYADIGGGPQLFEGNWYSRDANKDLYWYDFWTVRHGDPTWVGYGMNPTNDKLSNMFATYHEQISVTTHKRLFGKSNQYSDRIGAELQLGDGQTSAQGYIHNGNRLLLLGDPLEHKLLSQVMTIAPKTDSGEQIITKNFETSFGAILFNDPEKAIALSFRSSSPGAMIKDDASAGYGDKVTVVLSGAGYRIFDGESPAVVGNSLIPWNDGAVFNGENAHITIKAVGDKLTLKVTNDAGRVYLDNSSAPATVSTVRNGYCYYSSLDGYGYILYLGFARLDDNGKQADVDQNPAVEIVSTDYTTVVSAEIDRAQGQSMADVSLPGEIIGTTKDGYSLVVPVRWVSNDYRSYKDGTFDFSAVPVSGDVSFTANAQPVAKVVNKINGDYNTTTSRKYYFDSENDFKDFVCHLTSVNIPSSGTTTEVKMNKVDPLQCWAIKDGRAEAINSRTINGGWNGLNRASDVSTMVLVDDEMALLNFQIDIDYTHGTGWYPYILTDVQDPAQFFGDININRNALNLSNGDGTDLVFTDKTKKGGVWAFLEREGCFNFWGAVQGDRWGRVYYDQDITDGKDFMKNYDSSKQHHMTIRVLDGVVSMKVDDSDVYFANLDDAILGGYTGFAGCGTHTTYDNLTITALDELGDPMSLAEAEKGFAPAPVVDTYAGWQPFETDWAFNWKAPYTFD